MVQFYLDPGIKGVVHLSNIKEAKRNDDSDYYKPGDVIETWDHIFRWDEDCISNATMTEWRFRGDALADAALPLIMGDTGNAGGSDLYARLEAAANVSDPASEVTALWHELNTIKPEFDYDRDQIARGQAVFYRYPTQLLASLLQFSLGSGFSSLRVSRVLNLASYLVPPMESTPKGVAPRITKASNDRTFQRLMETTQWVVDCMSKDALEVNGEGWRACIRVRLLHATARRRLLVKIRGEMAKLSDPPYIEERDGIPISQEDYAQTLSMFSSAPIVNLMKEGITPSLRECEDWTALWKLIGYFIGHDHDILHLHMSNWHQCSRLLVSGLLNVFAGESDPPPVTIFPLEKLVAKQDQVIHIHSETDNADPWTTPATLPVLFSVCNRWPSPFNFADQCAAARRLAGPTLSDWLSIPRTSYFPWLKMHVGFAMVNLPSKFAQHYRAGWDARRRAAWQKSIEASIYMELGDRKTKFRPRPNGAFEPQKYPDEFGGFPGGQLVFAATEWMLLYAEMTVVLLVMSPFWPFYVLWILSNLVMGTGTIPLFAISNVLVPSP